MLCNFEGCDRTARRLGLCDLHYMQQRRHGAAEYVRVSGAARLNRSTNVFQKYGRKVARGLGRTAARYDPYEYGDDDHVQEVVGDAERARDDFGDFGDDDHVQKVVGDDDREEDIVDLIGHAFGGEVNTREQAYAPSRRGRLVRGSSQETMVQVAPHRYINRVCWQPHFMRTAEPLGEWCDRIEVATCGEWADRLSHQWHRRYLAHGGCRR
jgi:hypothetical protein